MLGRVLSRLDKLLAKSKGLLDFALLFSLQTMGRTFFLKITFI